MPRATFADAHRLIDTARRSDSRPLRPSLRFGAAALILSAALAASGASAADLAPAPAASGLTLVRFTTRPFDQADPVAESTNACVAAVSSSDLLHALKLCTHAVSAARGAFFDRFAVAFGGGTLRRDLAIAYCNRAVMYELSGNKDAAKRDIAKAADLMPVELTIESTRARIEAGGVEQTRVVARAAP